MTSDVIETRVWSRRRWFAAITAVLAVQALFVLLAERRSPAVFREPVAAAPNIRWFETISLQPLAVSDPTLFALPHREGFSGEAWLNRNYTPDFDAPVWTEPLRLLPLSAETLGGSFKQFVAANSAPAFDPIAVAPPAVDVPSGFLIENSPAKSRIEIEGPLSKRRLAVPLELRSWTNSDLLTNTIVQLLVNARGRVVSTVLRQSCGLKAADDQAVELSKAARFDALTNETGGQAVGTVTFVWQTLPAATNAIEEIQ